MAAMSHLSHLAAIDRPDSRVSLARSDTMYHSFQDIDLPEPEGPSGPGQKPTVCPPPVLPCAKEELPLVVTREMRRQDSGYESIAPREESSSPCPCPERTSSPVSIASSTRRRRTRPPHHRSSRSGPVAYRPRNGRHSTSPPGSSRSISSPPQQSVTYFHFPDFTSSDPALIESVGPATDQQHQHQITPSKDLATTSTFALQPQESSVYPLPPQTTHYWTSDRTRRLEYAAIDAASKGVRGWVMRHVVPDCFVPQSKRRIGFEDDRGSVVRYRLELDAEEPEPVEKPESVKTKGWRGWWFSMRRR
ncbi:hypothetical protein P885DRAFT_34666 [Corynascus similis CBS 632.67]